MREESHLDDMRSAIRGDFERLADRRGEQELMRVSDVSPAHEPEPARYRLGARSAAIVARAVHLALTGPGTVQLGRDEGT